MIAAKTPRFILAFLALFLLGLPAAFPKEGTEDGAFYFERGQEYFKKMEYGKALLEYERAVKSEPRNELFYRAIIDLCERFNEKDEKWRRTADFYRNAGEYDKALPLYEKVLSVRKMDVDALNAIGNIHGWKEEYGAALDFFDRSLKARENADAFLGRGDVYFFQNRLDEAKSEYEKALSLDPSHRLAHRRLGQVHEKRREYGEALREYQFVLKNKWNDADAWIKVGWIREMDQDFESAQDCYEKAVGFDPGNPDALNGIGRVCVALGRYDEAERYFKQAVQSGPGASEGAEAINGLGWLYAWKGDYQKALGYFYRALGTDELNIEAKTGLGWIYSRKEEYDKALDWYRKAGEGKTGSLEIASYVGMAWVYTHKEQYDTVIRFYKQVLETSPKNVEAYNGLGWLYLKKGDPDSALRFYERSIRLRERNPDAHYGLGQVRERNREFKEAIGHYRTALGYNTLNLQYRKALALCYFKDDDYENALNLLEKLSGMGADDEEIWNKLALLDVKFGRYQKAEEAYRRVLGKINPDSLEALGGLAEISFRNGDYNQAVELYEKVLAKDPENRSARRGLALAFMKKGLYGKAVSEFRRLLTAKHNDVESWNHLGWLYLRMREHGRAEECYQKGFSFSPGNPDGLVGLSYVELDRMRRSSSRKERADCFQRAAVNCYRVWEEYPLYKEAFLCLSELYSEMGDRSRAAQVLTEGLRVFDEQARKNSADRQVLEEALRIRGNLLSLKAKEPAGAPLPEADVAVLADGYRKLLESKVNDADVWLDLASVYRMIKRYGEAEQVLKRAAELCETERSEEIKLALAETLVLKGEPERAGTLYLGLLKGGARNRPPVFYGLGKVSELQDRFRLAAFHYETAVREHYKNEKTDYKEARLALARVLSKRGRFAPAVQIYNRGLNVEPLNEEYNLKAYKELGEIYLKEGFLNAAELSYGRCLQAAPGDFDCLMALAHIAKLKGDYPRAVAGYEGLLGSHAQSSYLHRMIGNICFWTRDWARAGREYGKAVSDPSVSPEDRSEAEKDAARLKKAGASSIRPRFQYAESKEDDSGNTAYITKTTAWDAGLAYTQFVNSRLSLTGGYSHSSEKERNLRVSQTNFDLDADYGSVGFEAHPVDGLEVSGAYHGAGYRGSGDTAGQRTPLRKGAEFQGYDAAVTYSRGESSLGLKVSKEPLRVKIFASDPELVFYSRYNNLIEASTRLHDRVEAKASYGGDFYSPSGIWKQLYRGNLTWRSYGHLVSFSGGKEDLPLGGFQRPDGLRVLGIHGVGLHYANNWVDHVTLKAGFDKKYYSDSNSADNATAEALFAVPACPGISAGYRFRYEDYKFTAGTVGGEPLYRSPQALSLHSFPVSYQGDLLKKLTYSAGYAFSVSSEGNTGNSAFVRGAFEFNEGMELNVDVGANDDASFSKERKYLLYIRKNFF